MTELEQFSEEFFQDILQESENGGWKEDFFFRQVHRLPY